MRSRTPRTCAFLATVAVLVSAVDVDAQTALRPDVTTAIDAAFSDIAPNAPGCAVGVVANRTLAYAKGFGLANLDYDLPITPSSVFYLGSVSKQFAAAAVAHAARAGHLSLDDPLQRWVPEIPEYGRTITVRNLVHHTSGLRDFLGLWSLSGRTWEDVHSADATLALIARQKNPNFAAGDEYLYSNTGYLLLSVVIERATGATLRDYLRRHFTEPLGMQNSRFGDDRSEVMKNRAIGYDITGDTHRVLHPWNYERVGAGGMYSSIEDLVHWDRNFYTEEVGGAGFTAQLLERGVLTDGNTIPYAFGLTHGEHRGLRTISHGGALAGFRTHLLRFPEQETTVLVLCNFASSAPEGRAARVADAVLADRLAPRVAANAAAPGAAAQTAAAQTAAAQPRPVTDSGASRAAEAYAGDYYSDELDVTWRIRAVDGGLILEAPPARRSPMTQTSVDQFNASGLVVRFDREDDRVQGFTIDAGRVRGIRFARSGR